MSHDAVNEQITIMGHTMLRSLLHRITSNSPAWYSIIGDEATDVASREQLTLSRMGPNLNAISVWADDFQIDGRSIP